MPLRCDMRFEKGEKIKDRPKAGSNHWSIASKRHDSWFTSCTTGADASVHSAVLLLVLPVPWLTDVSSSQRWVIYSQTNGAVSNYTYLFRFVWFVVVFSDLLFVFGIVVVFSELLFCFQNCDLFCTYRPPYNVPHNALWIIVHCIVWFQYFWVSE